MTKEDLYRELQKSDISMATERKMTPKRRQELESGDSELTYEEVNEGWHWCFENDMRLGHTDDCNCNDDENWI